MGFIATYSTVYDISVEIFFLDIVISQQTSNDGVTFDSCTGAAFCFQEYYISVILFKAPVFVKFSSRVGGSHRNVVTL